MIDHPSTAGPVPAMVELDGFSLQLLEPSHAHLVAEMLGQRGHRFILDLPPDEATLAAILAHLPQEPWALPLAVVRDGACVGMATTALANVKALTAGFTALFTDPGAAVLPLAMMVRHLFWLFPLQRIHAQIPAMDLTGEYVDLLTSVGFVDEGRLMAHVVIAGQPFDMVALGLLRSDFERWCAVHEPRLALAP